MEIITFPSLSCHSYFLPMPSLAEPKQEARKQGSPSKTRLPLSLDMEQGTELGEDSGGVKDIFSAQACPSHTVRGESRHR